MERETIIFKLNSIKDKVIEFEKINNTLHQLNLTLEKAHNYKPINLDNFDKKHMNSYINNLIGSEPQKPQTNIFNKKLKMKEYEYAQKSWLLKKEYALNEYFKLYEKERKFEKSKDDFEKNMIINNVQNQIEEISKVYKEVEKEIDEVIAFPSRYKEIKIVDKFISYLSNMRANSLSEAINTYLIENVYETIEVYKKEVYDKLYVIEEDLNSIRENLEDLEYDISNLNSEISNITNSISDLESKIDNLEHDIDNIEFEKNLY